MLTESSTLLAIRRLSSVLCSCKIACSHASQNALNLAGSIKAAPEESISGNSTHVLPVSSTPPPEEKNLLDRDIQGVLRKGTYNFARWAG